MLGCFLYIFFFSFFPNSRKSKWDQPAPNASAQSVSVKSVPPATATVQTVALTTNITGDCKQFQSYFRFECFLISFFVVAFVRHKRYSDSGVWVVAKKTESLIGVIAD
jgi:hypothetical protein